MTTIKKITAKTVFFFTAIIGFGFISTMLGKFFFNESSVMNLSELESVAGKDKQTNNTFIPTVQADVPGDDGDGSGGCGGSGGGSADGSAGF